MKMLDMIIKEFFAFVEVVELTKPIENDRIVVDKEYFKNALSRYQYMKLQDKIKAYKALNFIVHDKNNYTMPYRDREKKKTVRKVIINYHTFSLLKTLMEEVH